MKKVIWIVAVIALASCATQPEVLPEGKDSYLLLMSSDYTMASATDLRIEAHRLANTFCGKYGKRPETVTERTMRKGMQSDSHEEGLKFKCVEGAMIAPASQVEPSRPASGVTETSTDSH